MNARALALLAAAAIAATACGDDGSGPDDDGFPSGSITFDYTGPATADFTATGSIRLDDDDQPIADDFAAAARITNLQNAWAVAAFDHVSGDRGDLFIIGFEGLTAATTFTLDETCAAVSCPIPFFVLDTTLDDTDTDFAWLCTMHTGTVRVTEITGARIRGTFSGTGTCFDETLDDVELTVTGGNFDVPIVDEFELDLDEF